jgi:ankyrin repeat protein
VYASTDIWTAARRGDVDLLRILIEEEKNDVNEGDEDGSTPLHWAAYFDRYLQLSLSAAQLACVSLTFSLALGSSLSLSHPHRLEAISYLLQRGANIDALNTKESQTPLHWACIGKSLKVRRCFSCVMRCVVCRVSCVVSCRLSVS